MAATEGDYIVVGGGHWGAATVWALILKNPSAIIDWYVGTAICTASNDLNKVVRTFYPDQDYVALAKAAQKLWKNDSFYNAHYHSSGWVQARKDNFYKDPSDIRWSVEDFQTKVGSTQDPTLEPDEELLYNESVGVMDSEQVLKAVAEAAEKAGVRRHQMDVAQLIMDNNKCTGVILKDEVRKYAKYTIVATGCWTPGLLSQSNVAFPADFFTQSALGVAILPLEDMELKEMDRMPVILTEFGEILLSKPSRALRITTMKSVEITLPGEIDTESFDPSHNKKVLEKMLPQFAGRELQFRVCPDLCTPKQHFLLDFPPDTTNLLVVCGGSYHSAKYLPLMGPLVLERLHKTEDPQWNALLHKCTWESGKSSVSIHPSIVSTKD